MAKPTLVLPVNKQDPAQAGSLLSDFKPMRARRFISVPPLFAWLSFRLISWVAAVWGGRVTGSISVGAGWRERLWYDLVTPWIRWDGLLYLRIVRDGYRPDNGTTQFHPLYPMLARLLYRYLGFAPEVALLVVSGLAALGLAVTFYRLVIRLDGEVTAWRSLLTLFLWPLGWMLYAPYSESLFLWMTALTLLWALEERWWPAGLAAAAAVLTRQQGIFLLLVLVPAFWRVRKQEQWSDLGALMLPAVALIGWIVYRTYALDHSTFDLTSLHAFIYSVLISPNAVRVVPTQTFMAPWQALRLAVEYLVRHWPATDVASDMTLAFLTLLLLAATWHRMRAEHRLYAVVVILVAFSYFTGDPSGRLAPYMGLPRHLMLALPIFAEAGRLSSRERWLLWVISAFAYGWFIVLFEAHAWVP